MEMFASLLQPIKSKKWCALYYWGMAINLVLVLFTLSWLLLRCMAGRFAVLDVWLAQNLVFLCISYLFARLQFSVCHAALQG